MGSKTPGPVTPPGQKPLSKPLVDHRVHGIKRALFWQRNLSHRSTHPTGCSPIPFKTRIRVLKPGGSSNGTGGGSTPTGDLFMTSVSMRQMLEAGVHFG